MYGIIYEAINKLNNKRYIGQTTQTLQLRINNHLSCSKKLNTVFYKAIHKYGRDNFEWKIIDYAYTKEELDHKETFWIEFFNTYKNDGYNMTLGGQSEKEHSFEKYGISDDTNFSWNRKIMIFDKCGNYIKTVINQNALAKEINASVGNINRVLKGSKNSISGYILFFEDEFSQEKLNARLNKTRNTRDFVVFDAKTKECLGVWNNFTRCYEDTGFSRRMMEKQLINGTKTKPRKFIIKYITDCTEEELVSIYQKVS